MKATLLELLNDLRAAGRHASRAEVSAVFDTHFPTLVQATEPYAGGAMSLGARERGLAALLDATVAKDREIIAPSLRVVHTRRTGWTLAAAAIALILTLSALWFIRWNNPNDRIAVPSPPPKVTTPDKPQPKGPDLDREENPIVKDEPDEPRSIRPHLPPPKSFLPNLPTIVAEKQPVIGEFGEEIEGEPQLFVYGTDVGIPVKPGTVVTAGSRIETGDMDTAEIRLADGSVVNLGFNTKLLIPAKYKDGRKDVCMVRDFELQSGSIFADVVTTTDKQPFTVKTSVASARVLGTSFGLALEKFGPLTLRAVLQVKNGRVEFFNEVAGVVATEMTESTAVTGGKPTDPKRIRTLRDFRIYYGARHSHIRHETAQLNEETAERRYVYPRGWAGFTVAGMPSGAVRIAEIFSDGPARSYGLRVGDVIRGVDGEPVTSPATVLRAIAWARRRALNLEIERDGQIQKIPVLTIPRGRPLPSMDADFAELLFSATWPAMSGDFDTSLHLLREMLDEAPSAPAHNNLGVIFETRDEMGEAIRNFKAAVRLDPKEGLYRLNLAMALQKIGNISRSIEEAEQAVAVDPYHRTATFFLADAYALVDRFEDAIAVLQDAADRLPLIPRFWIRMSRTHIKAQNFPEAIRTADRAVQLDPENHLTHVALGSALMYAGRPEEAIEWYRSAIECSPAQASSYADLAGALAHLGRMGEAESALRTAVELSPWSARIRNQLGQLLAGLRRYSEAEREFRAAINFDAGMVFAHANIGMTLFELGRLPEAEAALQTAIRIDRNFAHGYGFLGNILLRIGSYIEAELPLRKAIRLEPEDPSAYFDLGLVLVQFNKSQEAAVMFRSAIELGLTHAALATAIDSYGKLVLGADALVILGRVYETNKDVAAAVRVYKRALLIEPRNEEAAKALKRILG